MGRRAATASMVCAVMRLAVLCLALVATGCASPHAAPTRAAGEVPVDVFEGGRDGYPAYRIPSIVRTARGTLLAFAEGRATKSDHAENDIVLKRSGDGGATWGPLIVVAQDGANALNNPTAVVLPATGRVLLLYQRYLKGFDERRAVPGYEDPRACRCYVTHSDDEGLTWSAPREITRSVKRPDTATSIASGPGVGIVLRSGAHRGRVVVPFNEGPYGAWNVYAAFSDDGGDTWSRGAAADPRPPGRGNEAQVAELQDGTLLLNARSIGGARVRKVATSRDGGATWSALVDEPALVEPECQASLIRAESPTGRPLLVFSNPASRSSRAGGLLRWSPDDGRTWPGARPIHAGSFAYSCLVRLERGSVGCLFERDDYGRIAFLRLALDG